MHALVGILNVTVVNTFGGRATKKRASGGWLSTLVPLLSVHSFVCGVSNSFDIQVS